MAIEYKKNKVKCDLGSYIHLIRGVRKVGKSTLYRDLLIAEYGDTEYGLHISVGNETGADALDDLITIQAEDWSALMEIKDDLIENKADNKFKLVCLDTVDELIKIAIAEVLRLHKKAKGQAAESLNSSWGGYGAGRKKVEELIDQLLADLRHAGYGIFLIGHTKLKDVKQKNGDEYQQLGSNLTSDYDGIFANKADIIMTISVDRDIQDGVIVGTKRFMHFRDDGFVDCGSRFTGMPDKVEYGAQNYIAAFEQGVKSSIVGQVDDDEIKKTAKAEEKKRLEKGLEFSKNKRENPVDEELNVELVEQIKTAYKAIDSEEKKTTVKAMMENLGAHKFSELEDKPTNKLQEILAVM